MAEIEETRPVGTFLRDGAIVIPPALALTGLQHLNYLAVVSS
jgi:hypothetical protein